jgi:hypothetical protein
LHHPVLLAFRERGPEPSFYRAIAVPDSHCGLAIADCGLEAVLPSISPCQDSIRLARFSDSIGMNADVTTGDIGTPEDGGE